MKILEAVTGSKLPKAEAEMLLGYALMKARTWVIAHGSEECPSDALERFQTLARRRKEGEPVAYLLSEREFFGRPFFVDRNTLIPRPATEVLVMETMKFLSGDRSMRRVPADSEIEILVLPLRAEAPEVIADIGTGSGCIAVSLALETDGPDIVAVDRSAEALKVAKNNAATLDAARIDFQEADGIEWVRSAKKPTLVVSNPPYIPSGLTLDVSVQKYEPHDALFAGEKGLDIILPLTDAAVKNPFVTGLLLELRTDQTDAVLARIPSGMLRP